MNNISPLKRPGKDSRAGGIADPVKNNDAELKELLITALANQQNEKQHSPQPPANNSTDEDELDLRVVFATLLHSKWLILAITALALLAGIFTTYISEPVYSADALVRIEKKKSLADTLGNLGEMLEGELPVSDEVEILRSRMILEQVVENLGMDIIAKPRFYPVIGKAIARRYSGDDDEFAEAWFGEKEYAWGGESIEVKSLEVPPKMVNKTFIIVAGQAEQYQLLQADGRKLLDGQVNQTVSGIHQIKLHISSLQARPGTRFSVTSA